jgi:ChrR Cupin-like domain
MTSVRVQGPQPAWRCDELALMAKPAIEFFDVEAIPWSPVAHQPGVSERMLAHDPSSGLLTRMVRWAPGLDTSSAGVVAHDYFEEVLILSGSIHDLTLGQTFAAGYYACRPPGMVHGPWTTAEGCVMLETRYAG